MIEQDKAIFIEYCCNCSSHVWCTKHDEGRYYSNYQILKQELEKQFEGFTVYGNTNPLTGKTIVPGLGAFEVFYKKCRVFSKNKSSIWPTPAIVGSRIKAIIDGQTPTGCELVDYAYDDAPPVVEKKRRVISIPKQLKRTFDCQTQNQPNQYTSAKNDSYPGTLDSIPTENQLQEPRVPSLKKDTNKPNSLIEAESKIRRRVVPMAKQDENGKKCCYHLYNSNKSAQSSGHKHAAVKMNNENYYFAGKSKSTMKDRNPKSLNEMSLQLQTMTDFSNFTNLYPSVVASINLKEEDAKKKYSNGRQLSVTPTTKAGSTYNKLEPLDKAGIAGQGSDLKHDASFNRKQRSRSQDMGPAQDQELNESTMFSQVSSEVSSVKSQLARARKEKRELQWFPDGTSDRRSPDRFDENILHERNQNADGDNNQDEDYEIDPAFVNKGKGSDAVKEEDFLTRLQKMRFPDEKLSQLRASRKAPLKKKITIVPDENAECKIEVYSTSQKITTMSSNQFNVAKGGAFKIPLKFDFQEIKFLDEFCLYILKNNRPWQKINLNINFF